jgi:sulfatase maturation enzyme AslB (radical SAM superfamily)
MLQKNKTCIYLDLILIILEATLNGNTIRRKIDMACIEHIYSVSALVGSSKCNANCPFCAAKKLRQEAATSIPGMPHTFKSAIKLSARYGGWSLSLTSSGEPTCSPDAVTRALLDYDECAKQGAFFPNVSLFTNGILLADDDFCNKWLPSWKRLGLTSIAVSVHSAIRKLQAEAYGIKEYPSFSKIFNNIKEHDLQCRTTILLRKNGIDTPKKYKHAIETLVEYGSSNISSWSVVNPDGSRNEYTPSRLNMLRIKWWLRNNAKLCHGHTWGGGVYDYNGTLVRITDYVTPHKPNKDYVRQLVVFQDGTVAYSWIKEGAICFKP